MSSRLRIAVVVFALMALIELGDSIALTLMLRDRVAAAAALGTTPAIVAVHAIVLLLLAIQIVIGSLIALLGLLRQRWVNFRMGGLLAATGYVVSGGFQVLSALLLIKNSWYALAGVVYIALGVLAFWLARSPVTTTNSQPAVTASQPPASNGQQ